MTKEALFETYVLPYLEDVLSWKRILFLADITVSNLYDLDLIKEREPTDREVDSFIVCGEYKIQFHRFLHIIGKIEKGDDVLYEYSDEKAFEKRPEVSYLQIY